MTQKEIIKLTDKFVIQSYKRNPVAFVKGSGVKVWDASGKMYLDFFSGLAVNNLGHCHKNVVSAVKKQTEKLMHTSNLFYTVPQAILAKKLVGLSFDGKVFFCNSGAEANEAAIKLCRKWGNPKRNEIITMKESFHGRTLTTITATGQTKYQKGFNPLTKGFKYAAFNDLSDVKKKITDHTVGIMVEPIQGEGGVNPANAVFFKGLRALCNKKKIILIFDEVQTGIGRTGKMFAFQHYGVKPDVMTLAKALGGGLPIGAMIASKKFADVFEPGTHASTFGGNAVVCAAACAVLETIKNEKLLAKSVSAAKYFVQKLNQLKKTCPIIKEVRGKGLMIGVQLNGLGAPIVKKCLDKGLIINCTQGNVIRFLPPLVVSKKEIDIALKIFKGALTK